MFIKEMTLKIFMTGRDEEVVRLSERLLHRHSLPDNEDLIAQTACELSGFNMRSAYHLLDVVVVHPEYLRANYERMNCVVSYLRQIFIKKNQQEKPISKKGIKNLLTVANSLTDSLESDALDEVYKQEGPDDTLEDTSFWGSVRALTQEEHEIFKKGCINTTPALLLEYSGKKKHPTESSSPAGPTNYKGNFQHMLVDTYENLPESKSPDLSYLRMIASVAVKIRPSVEEPVEVEAKTMLSIEEQIRKNTELTCICKLALQPGGDIVLEKTIEESMKNDKIPRATIDFLHELANALKKITNSC